MGFTSVLGLHLVYDPVARVAIVVEPEHFCDKVKRVGE
jgi:hypothetical protein